MNIVSSTIDSTIHTKNLLGSSKMESRHIRCKRLKTRNKKKIIFLFSCIIFEQEKRDKNFYGLNVIFLLCFGFEYLFTCDWYTAHTTGEKNRATTAAVAAVERRKKEGIFYRKEKNCNINSVYVCSVDRI